MRWNHLPAPGSLYDQHPKLIDDFQMIMEIENTVERKKAEEERRKRKKK